MIVLLMLLLLLLLKMLMMTDLDSFPVEREKGTKQKNDSLKLMKLMMLALQVKGKKKAGVVV